MIDLIQFFDRHGIEYKERGSGVKKGNVVIHCPFCGSDDRGHHLGVRLHDGAWGCWRNSDHRGKNLGFPLSRILGITVSEACRMLGIGKPVPIDLTEFESLAGGDYFQEDETDEVGRNTERTMLLPKGLRRLFVDSGVASKRFENYARGRGITERMAVAFDLRYSISGKLANRVVMPIRFCGRCVSYTSRAIGNAELRYLTATNEEETRSIKDCLYNFDRAHRIGQIGGRTLFIVEGPFDVYKLAYFGERFSCSCVGLFNMDITYDQLALLLDLADLYDQVVLVLDKGELSNQYKAEDQLVFIASKLKITDPPFGKKDPGELNAKQTIEFIQSYL